MIHGGVRYLIPGVMLMCIPAAEALSWRKLTLGVGLAGVFVQLLGVLVGPLSFVTEWHESRGERKALYVEGVNRVDYADIRFHPRYSQLVGHFNYLRALLGYRPSHSAASEAAEAATGTSLYDAVDKEFWEKAKWDIFWLKLPERLKDYGKLTAL